MGIFSFLKREEHPSALPILEAFAAEMEKTECTILDRATDAVTSLRSHALSEIAEIDARIAGLEGEIADLVERRRQSNVVLGMSEGGIAHLDANATVPTATASVAPHPAAAA